MDKTDRLTHLPNSDHFRSRSDFEVLDRPKSRINVWHFDLDSAAQVNSAGKIFTKPNIYSNSRDNFEMVCKRKWLGPGSRILRYSAGAHGWWHSFDICVLYYRKLQLTYIITCDVVQ